MLSYMTGEIQATCYTNPLLVPVESPLMFMAMLVNAYQGDNNSSGISWLYLPIDHYKIRIAQDDVPACNYNAYGEVATQWEVKGYLGS